MAKSITYADRQIIEQLYNEGARVAGIAEEIGNSLTTVYAELKRGRTGRLNKIGRIGYSAEIGQKVYERNVHSRRGGKRKSNEKSS